MEWDILPVRAQKAKNYLDDSSFLKATKNSLRVKAVLTWGEPSQRSHGLWPKTAHTSQRSLFQ